MPPLIINEDDSMKGAMKGISLIDDVIRHTINKSKYSVHIQMSVLIRWDA